tara:strand:+ start:4585 stop:5109 length:525 start_codon:yes stop_codon:yes gene_type:complete
MPLASLTVNVLALVGAYATNGKLSVGGLSSAITAGKIVDDESGDLITRNILDAILDDRDLGTGVAEGVRTIFEREKVLFDSHPEESSDISDLGGSRSQSRVRDGRSSRDDLRRVELVGVDLATREGVASKSDWSSTCSGGASSDGTIFNGRGSGEHARGGRCQDGSEEALHDVD